MIKEYEFQSLGEENNYQQFPDEIENNEHIFFYGTAEANFENIKNVTYFQVLNIITMNTNKLFRVINLFLRKNWIINVKGLVNDHKGIDNIFFYRN